MQEINKQAILRAKEDISYGCLESGVYYTPAFTKKVLLDNLTSKITSFVSSQEGEAYTSFSTKYNNPITGQEETMNMGITYNLDFFFEGKDYQDVVGFIGTNSFLGALLGNNYYTITLRELGGIDMPNALAIYPRDFDIKDEVTDYLDKWNSKEDKVVNGVTLKDEDRTEIIYTDTLAIVIAMITTMIDVVTYALVSFTALSLVVSTVMIAIITYVSVIERVKEMIKQYKNIDFFDYQDMFSNVFKKTDARIDINMSEYDLLCEIFNYPVNGKKRILKNDKW